MLYNLLKWINDLRYTKNNKVLEKLAHASHLFNRMLLASSPRLKFLNLKHIPATLWTCYKRYLHQCQRQKRDNPFYWNCHRCRPLHPVGNKRLYKRMQQFGSPGPTGIARHAISGNAYLPRGVQTLYAPEKHLLVERHVRHGSTFGFLLTHAATGSLSL